MIPIKDRINYYLGSFDYSKKEPQKIEPVIHDKPFKTDQNYLGLKSSYINDIKRYEKYTDHSLWLQCGDKPYEGEYPVLVKTRDCHNKKSKGVISNLNSARHWLPCNIAIKDRLWKDKKNNVIWRGATTGIKNAINNRETFVKKYFDKYDVGFSLIVQDCVDLISYKKPQINIVKMLEYKYLPVINGNDKSSALNWILISNSIPIMCRPRFHSWLCEPWLEPNIHYVEIKEDFSDFDEKIEWCKNNDDQCNEIAKNGRNFILENFTNEQHIEKLLINIVMEFVSNEN
jgi:hypothetical protein